ncbi:MAG: hypothetical protein IJL87_02780 [Clostridia bacterium]|nr:hypothetical protein [Clostridia bacterium]
MKTFIKNAFDFAADIHIVSKTMLKAGVAVSVGLMAGCLVLLLLPGYTGELSPAYWCDALMSLALRTFALCFALAFLSDFLLGRR